MYFLKNHQVVNWRKGSCLSVSVSSLNFMVGYLEFKNGHSLTVCLKSCKSNINVAFVKKQTYVRIM